MNSLCYQKLFCLRLWNQKISGKGSFVKLNFGDAGMFKLDWWIKLNDGMRINTLNSIKMTIAKMYLEDISETQQNDTATTYHYSKFVVYALI